MGHAGKGGRCSLCGATFEIPTPKADAPAPAPEPEPEPEPPPPAPAPPSPRDAFKIVRVDCACGREVPTPLSRLEQGLARCPSCDRPLTK
jgi:hypothetical protein